jgi:hypothetical protein
VHLDQFTGPGERRDIPAHSFARYAKPCSKIGNAGTAARAQKLNDFVLARRPVHVILSPNLWELQTY